MKVHWIGLDTPGRLGVSRRPDGETLDEQIARLQHGMVDHVVSLLEPAEAAKEIKVLISASTAQVGSGVQLVGQTGEALQRIVGRVA